MSAPMLGGIANFANNFTKAYGSERTRLSDEEERKAEREWRQEQQNRQRSEWKDQDQLKTDLKDAGAVRNVEQGTVVDGQTGAGPMQRTFTQNPEEASRVKAMMDAEAEMTGAAPAMQQPGTAVTGRMSQGHQISTGQEAGPMAQMGDPNSAEAAAKRTAQAYRQNGQMDKAMAMENAIMEQQARRLGLDVEQMKFADMQTNRALETALRSAPTWYEGAAKFATGAKRGGMDGMTVEPVLSPDGKTVTLRATMPDGTTRDTGTYAADESGMLEFGRKFAAIPLEKRMDIMRDQIKADKEDSRWERTFDFNKKKDEDEKAYKNRLLGFQARQEARAAETHKLAMEDAKIPPAVKQLANSYQEQVKSASAALNKAMAEGQFDPNNAGTAQLIRDQKDAMQSLADTLAPYTGKAAGGADVARPLGTPEKTPAAGAAPAGSGVAATTQAENKPVAKPTAPAATYTPPPTMAEIQAQTRQNRAQIAQRGEQGKQAERDPEIVSLREQHRQAIRNGKPMEANAIMGQINEIKAQRFGAQ